MKTQYRIIFILMFIAVFACKETKKENNQNQTEEKANQDDDLFSSYEKVKINKELANHIKIENLYIKSSENGLDSTKNYIVVFDFDKENTIDDISNYKLTIQLVPANEEKELLNDIAKKRKSSSEYYFLDINAVLKRQPADEISALFYANKKEYVSITFNTRLKNLQYMAILLRDTESNKYLKQNIKLKDFKL